MNIFTNTIKEVVKNCAAIDKKSVDHVSEVLDSFKQTIKVIEDISLMVVKHNDLDKKIQKIGNIIDSLNNLIDRISFRSFNVSTIFANSQNYIVIIQRIVDTIKQITNMKIPSTLFLKMRLFFFKHAIRKIYDTIQSMMDSLNLSKDAMANFIKGALFKPILSFFNEIKSVLEVLQMVNLKTLLTARLKLAFLKRFIKKVINSISQIQAGMNLKAIVSLTLTTSLLKFIISQFDQLLSTLREFLTFKKMFWLWWKGKKYIKRLKRVVKYLNEIAEIINDLKINIGGNAVQTVIRITAMTKVFYSMQLIVNIIKHFKIPMLFKFKIRRVISAIHAIRELIIEITKLVRSVNKGFGGFKLKSVIKKLNSIKKVFKKLIEIVKVIVLTTAVIILVLPILPVLYLCIFTLKLVINAIIILVKSIRFVSPIVFFKLTLFIVLLTILMTIGTMFIVFGLIVPFVLKSMLLFGAFILGLIAVIGMLALLGFAITFIAPLLPIIFIGITLIVGIIFAMMLLVISLKIIETIELNPKKILENIHTVLDTAMTIITSIFNTNVDIEENDENKPWYKSVLEWIGGTASTMIQAVLAVAFLALTFVSIALIMLIATQLRLLQILDLNPSKIKENVKIVIGVAQMVIDSIFDKDDDKQDKPTSKGFFGTVLDFFCKDLVAIFKAILAVAFLALMIVAITLISFMVIQLRLLQILDLNPDKIKENVRLVIDTAQMVVNSIFDKDDDKQDKPSKKGFFLTILDFFCPPLAKIFSAIMSIGYLVSVLVAIQLIKYIANTLKIIQDIDLDAEKVKKNVSTVIDAARTCVDTIFQQDETKTHENKSGAIERILRWVLGDDLVDLVNALMAIGYLAIVKTAVGMLGEMARDLAAIAQLPSMDGVSNKVSQITDAARVVITSVFSGGNNIDDITDMIKQVEAAETYLKGLLRIPERVSDLVDKLKPVVDLDNSFASKFNATVKDLISNIVKPFEEDNKLDVSKSDMVLTLIHDMNLVFDHTQKEFDNTNTIFKNYNEFLTKIDTMDLTKLQTTVKMFEQMSKFSESINGNFEDLADALNEKIAPMIEELKELLEGVQQKVEKNGSDISSSVYASSQGRLSQEAMMAQTKREMPNATELEQAKISQQRMEEQMVRQSSDLASKLDELIELFRAGNAQVKMA